MYTANKDITIDTNLVSLNRHKRRLRIIMARKKGIHQKEEWEKLKNEFKGICVRCGTKCIQIKDHIIPIYLGGSDSIKNIQPLCWTCNVKKGPETFNWVEYQRKYNKDKGLSQPARKHSKFVKEWKMNKCTCGVNEHLQMAHFAYPLFLDKNGKTKCPMCGG